MPSAQMRLVADQMIRRLAQSINDGWESGTISRKAARARTEVRYATEVWVWSEALAIVTGVGPQTLELYVTQALQGVKPEPGKRQGAMDEVVRVVFDRLGYTENHAPVPNP